MRSYMREVVLPLSSRNRRLLIFEQFSPTWAKYYTREEVVRLLESSGFTDVRVHHRHGYSWSVIRTKP